MRAADHQLSESNIEIRNELRKRLLIRTQIDDCNVLKQDKKPQRTDQRDLGIAILARTISQPVNQKTDECSTKQRHAECNTPVPASHEHCPSHRSADHERSGNGEIEEVQNADHQRERNRDQDVNASKHQTIDDLLSNHE